MTLTVGSLFAGIGGFDLGLERAGMRVLWQVEIDPYCQQVLRKHWPTVPLYSDIKEVRGKEVVNVDVLCGGFPCQDISVAGKGAGITGARSSLWSEYARLVGELRPSYVIVENVLALRSRGLEIIVRDLAELGYDAEWDGIRASDIGAPHRRARLWLVAYPVRGSVRIEPRRIFRADGEDEALARFHGGTQPLADADRSSADPLAAKSASRRAVGESRWWTTEPDVGRVAHGVPARVDRLRGLGNAIVPQIAEWIGDRILEYEGLTG